MSKNLIEDFVNEELVEFEVEGRIFKYKPVTAGQENDWLSEYMVTKDGVLTQDLTKLNKIKVRNIMVVPYSAEQIQEILGLEQPTEWIKLSLEQRWKLLGQLKPKLFSNIIVAINGIDRGSKKKS